MACRAAWRTVILTEPWRPSPNRSPSFIRQKSSLPSSRITSRSENFYLGRRNFRLFCSHNENPPFSLSSSSENDPEHEQGPPQEAVLRAISEVSKTEGRVGQTTNMVIGGTVTDDSTNEWLVLDQKVNSYPTVRGFTAIGTGGDDFVQAMVVAVESVIQHPIPQGQVKQKVSSGGKYVSVNIGPVQVVSSEQVQAVYNAMRRDERMKYFL